VSVNDSKKAAYLTALGWQPSTSPRGWRDPCNQADLYTLAAAYYAQQQREAASRQQRQQAAAGGGP
jgi:hypothetical protein